MAAASAFDLKRAGLLIRDAATVLCGTLLVEFVMEQANCLEKRLKPVLEVLPGVEGELEGLEFDWPRLVEDIKALLDACARFKAISPAVGECDYLEELYEPKKRAYNQLRSVKSAISTRFRAAEEAAATAAAATAATAAAAAAANAAQEQAFAAQEDADPEMAAEEAASLATDGSKAIEQEAVSAAVEQLSSEREFPPTLPSAAADNLCADKDVSKEKAKKKKKKAAKRELLFARPEYECLDAEVEEMEALASQKKAMRAELQEESSLDQIQVARLVLAASKNFGQQASPALLRQQASTLEAAGICLDEAGDSLANPHEASSACIRVAQLLRKVLVAAPSDDFARWDLVLCDEKILEEYDNDLDDRVYKFHAQETVDLSRFFYKHRQHYAPLFETQPEIIAYSLAGAIHQLIRLVLSDHIATSRLYAELATLHHDVPGFSDVARGGDRYLRGDIIRYQCKALRSIALEATKTSRAEEAIAAAAKGVEVAKLLDDDGPKGRHHWEEQFGSLAAGLVEQLSRALSIRSIQAKVRASRGISESEENKSELERIKRELEVARAALRDWDERQR